MPHLHYSVYGQRLCSNVELPGLRAGQFQSASMQFTRLPDEPLELAASSHRQDSARFGTNVGCDLIVAETDQGHHLYWERKASFNVSSDGRSIDCVVDPGVRFGWALTLLYATVMSFALHLQRVSNLHAGGIVTRFGAAAFIANPGTGKSTLTSMLASLGAPILTDDILALTPNGAGHYAEPGFPSVSLAKEAAHVILEDKLFAAYAAESSSEKARVPVDGNWASFAEEPALLRSVFVLRRGDAGQGFGIRRLSTGIATKGILEHTVAIPFLPRPALQRYFEFAAVLARSVNTFELTVPCRLPELARSARNMLTEIERVTGE